MIAFQTSSPPCTPPSAFDVVPSVSGAAVGELSVSFSQEAASVLKSFGNVGGPAAPDKLVVSAEGLSLQVCTRTEPSADAVSAHLFTTDTHFYCYSLNQDSDKDPFYTGLGT